MVKELRPPTSRKVATVYTENPADVISAAFNNLVFSVSYKNPVYIRPEGDPSPETILDKKDRENIELINTRTDPQSLIRILFDNPPLVYAAMTENPQQTLIWLKPPSKIVTENPQESDLVLTEKPPILPDGLKEIQIEALRDRIIPTCANYLKAPKIKDGFSEKDINRRGLWVLGVAEALRTLNKDPSNKAGHDWDLAFQEVWNNNKYASGKRSAVLMNLQISSMLQLPGEIQERMNAGIKSLGDAKSIFESGRIDEACTIIDSVCRDILNIFS